MRDLLSPVKAVAKRTRKRKCERAEILTASPYKKILIEKESAKKEKSTVKSTRKSSGKSTRKGKQRRRKAENEDDDDEDERWPCLECGEPFGESVPGEVWIRCGECQRWAHEACTPEEGVYVCHNCDSDDDL